MSADNPATALHRIIKAVRFSGANSVANGWTNVLGSEVGTEDFALKHAEVVQLFRQVYNYLNSLPEGDEDRALYMKYTPIWYRAIVYPDSWNASTHPAEKVIDVQSLDQLGGLGRLLHRIAGESLDDDAVAKLRDSLRAWRELLDEAGLPTDIAERIRTQVDLIMWLLDNLETYGAEPVIRESRNLVGLGVEAMQAVPAKAKKIGIALASLVYVFGLLHQGVDEAAGVLEGLNQVKVQYAQLTGGSADEPATASREIESEDNDVLDAEVVEPGSELNP
ncbi:hypothetical protein [Gordonia paraffinivorans]|uniref:hypothetical protein n=1 Tax=Gordonia paraffinivorans TaxID=175628 RepID=UPI001C92C646|nr:hypothetical protein [Gordonia paraffinivorans]